MGLLGNGSEVVGVVRARREVGVAFALRGLSGVPGGLEEQRLDGRGGRRVGGQMRSDGAEVERGSKGPQGELGEIAGRDWRRDCWERGEPVVAVVGSQ